MLDTGNTAWLTMATILVMLMTVPALALFYGGLVRSKNLLSVLMQCMICTAVGSSDQSCSSAGNNQAAEQAGITQHSWQLSSR